MKPLAEFGVAAVIGIVYGSVVAAALLVLGVSAPWYVWAALVAGVAVVITTVHLREPFWG